MPAHLSSSSVFPDCYDLTISECNKPIPPHNGTVLVSLDGIKASYSCNAGYILNGNNERFCQDDGKAWNGTDPTCGECHLLASKRTYLLRGREVNYINRSVDSVRNAL